MGLAGRPLLRVGGWDKKMCSSADDRQGYGRYSQCLAEPAKMACARELYSAKKAKADTAGASDPTIFNPRTK